MKWFLKVLRQYANFKGRASQKEYWMFVLFNILTIIALTAIGFTIMLWKEKAGALFLPYLYLFSVMIPSVAVTIRRLHDTNHSAWFLFVSIIPLIGGIWLLIVLILKGDQEDNRYGKYTEVNLTHYHRKRSLAVALILSSIFWLIINILLFFLLLEGDIRQILFILLPFGLTITGILLFSKRMFTAGVGWVLIILSVVWLIHDVYYIYNVYQKLSINFDFSLIISLFKILVPLALLLSGLYILIKKADRTVPACLLFVGSLIWILSIILNILDVTVDLNNILGLISSMEIVVPVSLFVFARTLLSKDKSAKEIDNKTQIAEQPVVNQPIERKTIQSQPSVNDNNRRVVFLREDRDDQNIWIIYQAASKVDAMSFLSRQTIDQPSYYIIVETPEGNFGRDKNGFYKE